MQYFRRTLGPKLLAIAVVLFLGFIVAKYFVIHIDREQREYLLQQTQYAALLVSPEDIAMLTGMESDIGSPVYERLKNQFTEFRSYNPRIRFVYLMGYRPDVKMQFFYVDSEPSSSPDYSPPGQIFPDTRQEDIDAYLEGETYISGPYKDSWGEWVSGNVPIHGKSGETVAMLGIDVATSVWHQQTAFIWTTVGISTLLLCVLMWILIGKIYEKQYSIETLTTKNKSLERNEHKLQTIQTLGQLGNIMFYFKDKTIVIDGHLSAVLGVTNNTLSFDQFLAQVHPDDKTVAQGAFLEIGTGNIRYSWFDVRIGNPTSGYRSYHIYGNVDRENIDADVRFSGIMQDVTDLQK